MTVAMKDTGVTQDKHGIQACATRLARNLGKSLHLLPQKRH